ncbi:hypothetical protein TrVE_jg14369 [Triparma verrucosa]|uniref:Rab-GAP TBC domain-containing protein n=1 Tax=Triparma verrucosa TaxID=1606542 RepID=A0A9W7CHV7_9STRA|nr:hypothetical protein TrVE_jg14369 [Triparma verrucosa]
MSGLQGFLGKLSDPSSNSDSTNSAAPGRSAAHNVGIKKKPIKGWDDDDDDDDGLRGESITQTATTTTTTATTSRPLPSSSSPQPSSVPSFPPAPTSQTPPSPPPRGPLSPLEAKFSKILNEPNVNLESLKAAAWCGCPESDRGEVWRLLLGYSPTNRGRRETVLERKRGEYWKAIEGCGLGSGGDEHDHPGITKTEQVLLRQILVDLPRTAPSIPLFHHPSIQLLLKRVLYLWSIRNPACSYVQGLNDLCCPFVWSFLSEHTLSAQSKPITKGIDVTKEIPTTTLQHIESDTYWCLTGLLNSIQDHYTPNQPGLQKQVYTLSKIVERTDANLSQHLTSHGVEFIQFAFKWCNCLLVREFDVSVICRLWDTHISEGSEGFSVFHVYTCAALLGKFSEEVQGIHDFGDLFQFLQGGMKEKTEAWGEEEVAVLCSQAFVLKSLFQNSQAHLT